MKIQDVARKHPAFDKPAGEAEYLIRTGQFVKAEIPTESAPIPNLQFAVREGRFAGIDYQYPDYIFFSCSTCGLKGTVERPSDGFRIRHCGVAQEIPSHIRQEYERRMANYKSRSRKPPQSKVDDRVTDPRILSHFGLKTKEQLVAQTRADIELASRGKK
jgi:hypothetical protein